MSKRIAAKHKIDRRLGVNLWGSAKSPVNTRSYALGQHGNNKKKPTEVPAASSPKTSDKLPVPIIAGIALLSVVAVFISRKKMSA